MLSALCQPAPRPCSRQGASSAPSHTQVKALEETFSCSRKFTNSANLVSLIMGGDGVDFETEGKDKNNFNTQMKRDKQNTMLQIQYKYTV